MSRAVGAKLQLFYQLLCSYSSCRDSWLVSISKMSKHTHTQYVNRWLDYSLMSRTASALWQLSYQLLCSSQLSYQLVCSYSSCRDNWLVCIPQMSNTHTICQQVIRGTALWAGLPAPYDSCLISCCVHSSCLISCCVPISCLISWCVPRAVVQSSWLVFVSPRWATHTQYANRWSGDSLISRAASAKWHLLYQLLCSYSSCRDSWLVCILQMSNRIFQQVIRDSLMSRAASAKLQGCAGAYRGATLCQRDIKVDR